MAIANSRQLARAKVYLKIDPLVLCGEIVTEVSIPHNLDMTTASPYSRGVCVI